MRSLIIRAVAGVLSVGLTFAAHAQPAADGNDDGRIYGWQLMTEQERAEQRSRMRNADSPEARERLRREHHERMRQRAKERGVSLPEEPPDRRGKGQRKSGGGPNR